MNARKFLLCLFSLCACLLFGACRAPQAASGEPYAAFQPFLGRSLSYLARQVDESGLLAAAPAADPQSPPAEHWLAPDNQLALWAFETARAGEAAAALRAALEAYAPFRHGLVETLHGETVTWPPQQPTQQEVRPGVRLESYAGSAPVAAWERDPYLLLVGALNAWNAQDAAEAQRRYAAALARFDGQGFTREETTGEASTGVYATRDLALAVFTGARIGASGDRSCARSLVAALLAQQAPSGGFYAAYTAAGPRGDTTTEATAYAALALMAVRQE